MSLNDIRLTPQLLTELYGNVLVKTAEQHPAEERITALGNNEKAILILVATEAETILPQSSLQFLTSVLAACKLTLADVAVVNWNVIEQDYKKLVVHFESRFVLLFDVAPHAFGLPMDFPPFQVQAFDSRQYLYAPPLQQIQESKPLKAELWNALKKLFLL
jgi:hypothetical protein